MDWRIKMFGRMIRRDHEESIAELERKLAHTQGGWLRDFYLKSLDQAKATELPDFARAEATEVANDDPADLCPTCGH